MMKFHVCLIAIFSAISVSSSSALAALNIYEPFNYSTGSLQGQVNSGGGTANGNTWLQAGSANPPSAINVTTGSLTGSLALPPSVGNALSITGNGNGSGSTNRLALGQQYTSGTVYYSFLLDATDLNLAQSNNTTGGFFFSLNNTGNSSQTGNPSVVPAKVQARIDPNDATKYDLGIFTNESATAGASSWATNQLAVGDTHFIVGSYDVTNKVAKMWIDPDASTFSLASAPVFTVQDTNPGATFSSGIQSVLVRQSPAQFLTLDELRVGSTWADVTPTLSAYWDIDGATAGAGGAGRRAVRGTTRRRTGAPVPPAM